MFPQNYFITGYFPENYFFSLTIYSIWPYFDVEIQTTCNTLNILLQINTSNETTLALINTPTTLQLSNSHIFELELSLLNTFELRV